MRQKVINADTIDAAVEEILDELKNTSTRENVIYFDGWDGLGASAVLRAVAQRLALKELARPPELEFEQVIHVDCSKWESTRRVQREIAKELKLPSWVMEMFDEQDDEDDFDRKPDQGSRTEIANISIEILKSIQGRRFLLLLHNGSNEEIDISSLGLSLYGYLRNKMIWTFQGRFRIDPKMKDNIVAKSTTTDLLLSASNHKQDPHELWSYLLREEATQVACKHGSDPAIVVECFLYTLKLYCTVRHADTEYDLATHTCNYWICDGLIQKLARGDDIGKEAWQDADALHGEMRLGMDCYHTNKLPSHFVRYAESKPHWTSPAHAFVLVPHGVIPSRMSQHFDKLGVLKLSSCTFSFSSPPFLCCTVLRFLWLDHCQDLRSTDADKKEDAYGEEDTTRSWACFQTLWVLDLRYTYWDRILSAQAMDLMTKLRELNVMGAKNWDMSPIRGRLRNIRKLRITKSTCSFDDDNLFSEMESMELLDFSGNHITPRGMASISGPAKGSRLKTVIIDGCDGLKTISLSGCRELKKLLLKGLLGSLEVLDLSGTRVKTLNLGEVDTPVLKRLILLGCDKLVAINQLSKDIYPDVLRIDTTSTSASAQHEHPVHGDRSLQQQKEEKFNQWQICLADARLLRSLDDAIYGPLYYSSLHIDICPGGSCSVEQGRSRDKTAVQISSTSSSSMVESVKYRDVFKDVPIYRRDMMMWDCPEIPVNPSRTTCIIKVMMPQGQGNKRLLPQGAAATITSSALSLPRRTCRVATSLHVYDNSCITSIPTPPQGVYPQGVYPQGPRWRNLIWCRVERCPKLHTLFATPRDSDVDDFINLRTLWVSQLLTARYISTDAPHTDSNTLTFLHLDYCPRLIHVLPLSIIGWNGTAFRYLETLVIVCCGDMREVFPFVPAGRQDQDTLVKEIRFLSLRRIHLHELPMLHHICPFTISAPNLETIKIRGCWSLRRLPAIGADTQPPMVDCEKEWWDTLEWDGLEAYHHPSLYRPTHSLHYQDASCPEAPYSGNPSLV